jgi:hypothetical protein
MQRSAFVDPARLSWGLRWALSLLAAMSGNCAHAQIQRQHGAHVHGEATIDLALDGSQLTLTLEAPGMSFAGFEHAPRDGGERKTLDDTVAALKAPTGWLVLPPAAGCKLDEAKVVPHGFGGTYAAEQGGDAHDAHSDFDAAYRFTCITPAALRAFDLRLFERFPALHKLRVNLVLPERQDSVTLAPGDTRVTLSP